MDLLKQLLELISGFGSMASPEKVAAVLTLAISLWKSSLLQPLWAKLGKAQVLVAPLLGIALAVYQLPGGVSLANIWIGLKAGGLAIAAHELLTAIELIPGIGPVWLKWVGWVDGLLYKPKA